MDQLLSATTVGIVKLEGAKNWNVWKFQMGVLLRGLGVYEIAEGTRVKPEAEIDLRAWQKEDSKAQSLIVTRLSEPVMLHVLTCTSAMEMWRKLHSVYEQKSDTSIHMVQQQFFQLKYNQGMEMSLFISKVQEFQHKLKQLGEEISDKFVMTKILMSLPEGYSHFISAWESASDERQTLDNLIARLLVEEERLKPKMETSEKSVALTAVKKSIKCFKCGNLGHYKKDCKNNSDNRNLKRCYVCNKKGHLKSECRFNNDNYNKKQAKDSKESNAFIVTAMIGDEQQCSNSWLVDSGASEHMTFDRTLLVSYSTLTNKKSVIIGDGRKLDAVGVGQVVVKAFNGKCYIETTMSNVLHVPELKLNLFSVASALNKGYSLKADIDKWEFIKGNKIGATATRSEKFYIMDFKYESLNYASANIGYSLKDWHEKMAHQNYEYVKDVLKNNNIKFTGEANTCKDCLKGKQHRIPFQRSESSTSKVGELIHADVCGPMEEVSIGGSRYFLLLKDDYSNYRTVYFMSQKSETEEKIKLFLEFVETITGNKIKTLRTDNGLEFINTGIKKLLEKKGIIHETTVSYSPEQNGKAERDMRTIVEAARTMLEAKRMNKNLWTEAVNTSVYVLNRSSKSRVQGITPFKLWTGKDFDLKLLQVFGTEVFVHIPKEKRKKWDCKGEKGIFVGYGETTKGYRVYFPEKETVKIKRDVIFVTPEVGENWKEDKQHLICPKNDLVLEHMEDDKPETEASITEEKENEHLIEEIQETEGESNEEYETPDEEKDVSTNTTRSGRCVRRPQKLSDYESGFIISLDNEPTSYAEAMGREDADKWKEAINNELNLLNENNTWTRTKLPEGKKAINSKWVFKVKRLGNDKIKYKARLVARGFEQKENFDFHELYAPVAKLNTFRVFMSIATKLNLPVHQMDVCSAFLNSKIEEDVYLKLPEDIKFDNNENNVCKLNKSIYGLKKSPRYWNQTFDKVMISEGYVKSSKDGCLYTKSNDSIKMFLLLYVDDILLFGNNNTEIKKLKEVLFKSFKMKDMGRISKYLGMNIEQDLKKGITTISQNQYLKNVLEIYGMSECKPLSLPIDKNFKFDTLKRIKSESKEIETRCRKLIGCLMYAAIGSRPDICATITMLSRFQDCASAMLYKLLKNVLRYIKGTIDLNLVYKRDDSNTIEGFVDSDWGGNPQDRKSTTGYCFKVFNCTVIWSSKKQQSVALSTTESEYTALSTATSEACWLKELLLEFGIKIDCIILYEDNQSAIKIARNPTNRRIKHLDIKHYFIKEKLDAGIINIKYICTSEQIGDIFTKPLGGNLFKKFRNKVLNIEQQREVENGTTD